MAIKYFYISDYFLGCFWDAVRTGNFSIRLALLVLFSHHFPLSGRTEPTVSGWDTFGFVAVAIFFAISGFIMPQSYDSAGNFIAFMAKRFRRIFPGLIVCCFLMVYVIGAIFTETSILAYFLIASSCAPS